MRKKLFKEKSQQISNSATDGTSKPRHNNRQEIGDDKSFRPPLSRCRRWSGRYFCLVTVVNNVGIARSFRTVFKVVLDDFIDIGPRSCVGIDGIMWRNDLWCILIRIWINAWKNWKVSVKIEFNKKDIFLLTWTAVVTVFIVISTPITTSWFKVVVTVVCREEKLELKNYKIMQFNLPDSDHSISLPLYAFFKWLIVVLRVWTCCATIWFCRAFALDGTSEGFVRGIYLQ